MSDISAEIHALIDDALNPTHKLPFHHLDTVVMSSLYEELSDKFSPEVVLNALDKVRARVYGQGKGSDLRQLHTTIRNCRSCPAQCRSAELPLGNLANPTVVAITEVPGLYKPTFELLTEAGFPASKIVVTSLIRCEFETKAGTEVYDRCGRYLFSELGLWSPRLSVLVGSTVAKFMLGTNFSISDDHGRLLWVGPYAVCPIFAPGWLNYQSSGRKEEFTADIARALRFAFA